MSEDEGLPRNATKHFLSPVDTNVLFAPLVGARASLPQRFSAVGSAFAANLSAVVQTVSMPYSLAAAASQGAHRQRFYLLERLRDLTEHPEHAEDVDAEHLVVPARERAMLRAEEFFASDDGFDQVVSETSDFLLQALDSRTMVDSATQLLLQGEVLAWSALETLARDVFEVVLNGNPKLIQRVLADSTAKHRIPNKFTIEDLAAQDFDLSTSLGTVLILQQDFSDIKTVKALLEPLFEQDRNVRDTLADRRIWMLSQRRHLIVHRQGIVDARYIDATGATVAIGSRVVVEPKMLEDDLAAVGAAGAAMLVAAGKTSG